MRFVLIHVMEISYAKEKKKKAARFASAGNVERSVLKQNYRTPPHVFWEKIDFKRKKKQQQTKQNTEAHPIDIRALTREQQQWPMRVIERDHLLLVLKYRNGAVLRSTSVRQTGQNFPIKLSK